MEALLQTPAAAHTPAPPRPARADPELDAEKTHAFADIVIGREMGKDPLLTRGRLVFELFDDIMPRTTEMFVRMLESKAQPTCASWPTPACRAEHPVCLHPPSLRVLSGTRRRLRGGSLPVRAPPHKTDTDTQTQPHDVCGSPWADIGSTI